MVRFELKKIISKPASKIIFLILFAVLCIVSYLSISNVSYVDENGDTIKGISAARSLREAKGQWSGYITEEELLRVWEQNAQINNSEEAVNHYSDKEKNFLITQYRNLKTPFYYEYFDGWEALLQDVTMIIMLVVLITGFLVSGIFSDEIQLKADSVFFSSKLGRTKAIAAKICAGFIIITAIYWIMILLYSGIVLSALGFEGADCPIQVGFSNWKSFYNITYFQDYLLTIFGGYAGSLFILMLSMLVSAKTHSGVFAVTIPFILLFIPEFLSGISELSKILGLLPDKLLQICEAVRFFSTYQIGNKVIGAVPIILTVYPLLSCILFPVIYQVYRKYELK